MLEAEGVTDVFCCGLVLDICVKVRGRGGRVGGRQQRGGGGMCACV